MGARGLLVLLGTASVYLVNRKIVSIHPSTDYSLSNVSRCKSMSFCEVQKGLPTIIDHLSDPKPGQAVCDQQIAEPGQPSDRVLFLDLGQNLHDVQTNCPSERHLASCVRLISDLLPAFENDVGHAWHWAKQKNPLFHAAAV